MNTILGVSLVISLFSITKELIKQYTLRKKILNGELEVVRAIKTTNKKATKEYNEMILNLFEEE